MYGTVLNSEINISVRNLPVYTTRGPINTDRLRPLSIESVLCLLFSSKAANWIPVLRQVVGDSVPKG